MPQRAGHARVPSAFVSRVRDALASFFMSPTRNPYPYV